MANENFQKCVDEIQAVSEKYEKDADVLAVVEEHEDKNKAEGAAIISFPEGLTLARCQGMWQIFNNVMMREVIEAQGTLPARHLFENMFFQMMDFYKLDDEEKEERIKQMDGYSMCYRKNWIDNINKVAEAVSRKEAEGKPMKLRPCPKCGAVDEAQTVCEDGVWNVTCGKCFYDGKTADTEKKAVLEWNHEWYMEVGSKQDAEKRNTYDKFAEEFEALCKRYEFTGSCSVNNGKDTDDYTWSVMNDENDSDEYLKIQLKRFESGIHSIYTIYGIDDWEKGTEVLINSLGVMRKREMEWVKLMNTLKQKHVKEQEGKENA